MQASQLIKKASKYIAMTNTNILPFAVKINYENSTSQYSSKLRKSFKKTSIFNKIYNKITYIYAEVNAEARIVYA